MKKHLKDIFVELGIARRAQLAQRVKRGPERETPTGMTRSGGVTITRGPV